MFLNRIFFEKVYFSCVLSKIFKMKIDQILNQTIKDIVKAISIYITQIFSVVTFYQILFSNYMSDKSYKHIIIMFALFFTIVFLAKTALHINELIVRLKELKNGATNQNVQNQTPEKNENKN